MMMTAFTCSLDTGAGLGPSSRPALRMRPSTNLYALIQESSPFAVSGRDNVDVPGQTGPAKQHQQHMKKKGRVALTLQDQSWAVQPVGSCWLQRFPSRRFRS